MKLSTPTALFQPAALVELVRANELAPTFRILYSIALVQLRLSDYAGAKDSFEHYLAGGGSEISGARKTEVDAQLVDLATRVAAVDVTVNEADATVLVDDIAVGQSPLARTLFLNPGFHKIGASKQGFSGRAKQLVAPAGGQRSAGRHRPLAAVAPIASAATPATESPGSPEGPAAASAPSASALPVAEPPPSGAAGPPLWIGWAATGALVVGAAVTGIAALDQSSKVTSEINQEPATLDQISAAHDRTVALALTSDILSGAAIVAGAVSLYFTLRQPRAPAPSARLTLGPGGAGLAGTF